MVDNLKNNAYIIAEEYAKNTLKGIPEVQKEDTYKYNLELIKQGINIAIELMATID